MALKTNERYTSFAISDYLAHTVRRELTITDLLDDRYVFSLRGKRKKYYLDIDDHTALFQGWNLPFIADSDTTSFSGNALMNIVGPYDIIKDYFDTKQLNPDFQNYLVVWIDRSLGKQTETPVYLSLAQNSGHAVLNRMLDKMGMERALSMAERYDQKRSK